MLTYLFAPENFWLKFFVCFASSYIIASISIKVFLKFINNKSICRQPIRSDGPQTHLKNKKNTPTMGGVFIVLSSLISSILFLNLSNHYIWIILLVFLSFAAIGLADDLLKVIYKNPNGFRGSIKLIIQFLIIGAAFIWLGEINAIHANNRVFFPIGSGHSIGIGAVLYILFVTFVIVGTSNAVNLTDGLDGLVSVPAIINLICLSALIYLVSDYYIANKFHLPFVKNSSELIFFCACLIGSIIGFLQFNIKPAKIFMGDVGSLAIGSAIGLIAIIIKQEFVFFIISLLFVTEAVSVILQVGSYKLRKKRIFLMAPIHHHFEKLGWAEQKVVKMFWLISLIFASLGMVIILS